MKDTLEIINQAQAGGVIGRYAIGGSVGAIYYIEVTSTDDLDIFVELPSQGTLLSLEPLYTYLKNRGCSVVGERILVGEWPVQFLVPPYGLEQEALEQARKIDFEGEPTWVMRAEHLVAICLKTGRARDMSRIVAFVEADAIDYTKLNAVLVRFKLVPKWDAFEERYLKGL